MTFEQAIAQAQGLVGQIDPRGFFMDGDVKKDDGDLQELRRQAVASRAVSILLQDCPPAMAFLRFSCQMRAKQAVWRGGTIHEAVTEALSYWRSKQPV